MSTASPTVKPLLLASPALMAISSSACGPVPSLSWISWSSPVQLPPKRWPLWLGTSLPFLPITLAPLRNTWPVALATPGTVFTRSTVSAGSVAPPPRWPFFGTGWTCTSV